MNKNIRNILLITLWSVLCTPLSIMAQRNPAPKNITITTIIKDSAGNPVPGAEIYGREGSVKEISDAEGRFSIEIPAFSDIRIHAKGFKELITSGINTETGIILENAPFLASDDDIVYLPFAKVKRRDVVGAVSTIDPNNFIKFDNTQSVTEAINGRIPGLFGSNNIRGLGNALVVVDGVRRNPGNINLEEVEQVTVLKDANASLLYGAYARNGVIMITTKRGEAFKRKINVSAEQGISTPLQLPKYLNSADYMELYNEALANDGLAPKFLTDVIEKTRSGVNPYRYPDVDYYSSEFLRDYRNFTKVLTEFSGGNNVTQYYANVGWNRYGSLYNLGEGKNSASNSFNVRGNVNFKLNEVISSYVDAVFILDTWRGPRGNFWDDAATLHPYYYAPIIPLEYVNNTSVFETARRVNGNYILGGTSQYQNNVYGNMMLAGNNDNVKRTAQFNTGIDFNLKGLTQGLKFKTYLSFDIYNQYDQLITNTYAVYQPTWAAAADTVTNWVKHNEDLRPGSQNLDNGGFIRIYGFYGMFDYNRTFNNVNNVTGMLIGYFGSTHYSGQMQDDRFTHLGLRLAYNYNQTYFIDFNSSIPYSVKLEGKNRIGFSPSLGLGWIVSESDWWNVSVVNYLKLRASAGIHLHDVNLDYNYSKATYRSGSSFPWNDAFYSNTQTLIDRSANPNLGYERMKSLNFGIESYLVNNHLFVDANAFLYRDADKVVRRNSLYPDYFGPYYPYENYGENSYSGFEIGATWSQKLGDFTLDFGANLVYTRSEVVKANEIWENSYQYRKGKPVNAIFALESIGFFANQADISESPSQRFGEVKPGDLKYKDQNNDGVIDDNDYIQVGNYSAPFAYGLHATLKYKIFTLFALANGATGYENFFSNNYFWVDGNDKYSESVLNRWTPENSTNATYPRLTSKSGTNNFRNSTFWLRNMDYFYLSRLQLTCDLPANWFGTRNVKDISLYLRGSNLLMLSEYTKERQLNIGSEPQYRNFAIGVRMMF